MYKYVNHIVFYIERKKLRVNFLKSDSGCFSRDRIRLQFSLTDGSGLFLKVVFGSPPPGSTTQATSKKNDLNVDHPHHKCICKKCSYYF